LDRFADIFCCVVKPVQASATLQILVAENIMAVIIGDEFGPFDDSLVGTNDPDTISGLDGNDTLTGGAGADSMSGGVGNDHFNVDLDSDVAAGEVYNGGADTDTINYNAASSVDFSATTFTSIENFYNNNSQMVSMTAAQMNGLSGDIYYGDYTLTTAGSVDLAGSALAFNSLTLSNLGNSVSLAGSTGYIVTITGGSGNDTITGGESYATTISGGGGNDSITGGLGGEYLYGDGGNDTLNGDSGNDTLTGGAGADSMSGGAGSDSFDVVAASEIVAGEVYNGGADTDTIYYNGGTSVDFSAATFNSVENFYNNASLTVSMTAAQMNGLSGDIYYGEFILTTAGSVDLAGSGLSFNSLTLSNLGNSVSLVGSTGYIATITGGSANDTITGGDNFANTISGGGGNDSITGGSDGESLYGDGGNDTLNGGSGGDILTGGAGADSMSGGTGNDWFNVDAASEIVAGEVYNGGADTDAIYYNGSSSVDFSAATFTSVENFYNNASLTVSMTAAQMNGLSGDIYYGDYTLTTAGSVDLAGSALAFNSLTLSNLGNSVSLVGSTGSLVTITGGSGNDTITGGDSYTTTISGGGGNDSITGGLGAESLAGEGGNDTLTGGAGADYLAGGTGNDTYVDADPTEINEVAGEGTDLVLSSSSYTLAALVEVENLSLTGSGNSSGTGNAANNMLTGNSGSNSLDGAEGNDTLTGGGGTDTLIGGAGNDTYVDPTGDTITELAAGGTDTVQSGVTFTLASLAEVENLTLTGVGNIDATGNAGNNVITGNAGNNTLTGGGGADTLIGGAGNDTYVDPTGDTITELAAGGTDTVQSGVTFTMAAVAEVENLTLTGVGNIDATGNAGNNVITGNAGNNTLTGGGGTDTLIGGAGNDIYVDPTGDTITELAAGGTDTVQSGVTFTLAAVAEVENLTLTGVGNIDATGNTGNNVITGNAGNNALDGASGNDTLNGAAGNDTLTGGLGIDRLAGGIGNDVYVADASDTIAEVAGEGTDTLQIAGNVNLVSYANVENVTLTGSGNLNAVGSSANNVLTGNAGNNRLTGGGGTDTLIGGLGNDTYVNPTGDTVTELAGQGTDTVESDVTISIATFANVENLTLTGAADIDGTGNAGNNVITGNSGNNVLTGGAGADTLVGGAGNDTYVDPTGDTITELAAGGTDTVQSGVTFTLEALAEVENLTLTGVGNIDATGNAGNNVITGNAGNNTLTGGGGTDTLIGGAGNDTYVDPTGDTITELAAGGTDTVQSGVTFTLAALAEVENLTLSGLGNIDGTGNAGNNLLTGNAGNNRLTGGGGTDTLIGGLGNDTYVNPTGDTITELAGQGFDTVESDAIASISSLANVEAITLTGTASISATGNAGNNVLTGNAGNNILNGSTGADTMIGGAGNDTYFVDAAGDQTIEDPGNGTDGVISTISRTLATNIENLTLFGVANIDGNGNTVANVITGNGGNNTMRGYDGADTLVGNGGADLLIGGNARDTLKPGVDTNADTIKFASVAESTGIARDIVYDMDLNGEDKFDFPSVPTSVRATITVGLLDGSTFDANLAAAVGAGQMGAGEAVLFDPSSGNLNFDNHLYLVVDANGVAGYQAGADYVVQLFQSTGTLSIDDFV
jgi:Ca2+-binding RTX toxin-like protein